MVTERSCVPGGTAAGAPGVAVVVGVVGVVAGAGSAARTGAAARAGAAGTATSPAARLSAVIRRLMLFTSVGARVAVLVDVLVRLRRRAQELVVAGVVVHEPLHPGDAVLGGRRVRADERHVTGVLQLQVRLLGRG